MNVQLVNWTPEAEATIWNIAKICYNKDTKYWTTNTIEIENGIRKLIKSGHLSPLEHVSITFEISGISRACSHQLVRHRLASHTQQSQRYVDMGNFDVVVPESIGNNIQALSFFAGLMDQIGVTYEELINLGITKEDARYVLPNACTTTITVTMNARELLHFFELRCCNRAQWEIREVANRMLELCQNIAPIVFENAGAPCTHGECHEVHPCNKQ